VPWPDAIWPSGPLPASVDAAQLEQALAPAAGGRRPRSGLDADPTLAALGRRQGVRAGAPARRGHALSRRQPSRFRPERFLERTPAPSEFLPFGGGRRACIGMAFAPMEMRVVLAALLARARLRLVPGARVCPEFRGITIAPSNDLRAIVDGVENKDGNGSAKGQRAQDATGMSLLPGGAF
jgi:hypothetical protein